MIANILTDARNGRALNAAQATELLRIPVNCEDYYALLFVADAYARQTFQGKGMVFAQIGIDAQGCRIDCKFCSLAKSVQGGRDVSVKSMDEVVAQAKALASSGIQDLFLMTTAEFSQERFLEYGRAVRAVLPRDMRLVANVGDFDFNYAHSLKYAGFTGAYHIHRLREGVDTGASPEARVNTLNAVRDAGMELYYCVEPIGPEHAPEELVQEMLRIREYPVGVMAVMKRIAVPGTPLAENGEITAAQLAKICAVTVLVSRPQRAMGVHEPDELCLMAGANQIYAECGTNPRDMETETEKNRGFSTVSARKLLTNTQWQV